MKIGKRETANIIRNWTEKKMMKKNRNKKENKKRIMKK